MTTRSEGIGRLRVGRAHRCSWRQILGSLIRHASAPLPLGVAVIGAALGARAVSLPSLGRGPAPPQLAARVRAVGLAAVAAAMDHERSAARAAQHDESLQATSAEAKNSTPSPDAAYWGHQPQRPHAAPRGLGVPPPGPHSFPLPKASAHPWVIARKLPHGFAPTAQYGGGPAPAVPPPRPTTTRRRPRPTDQPRIGNQLPVYFQSALSAGYSAAAIIASRMDTSSCFCERISNSRCRWSSSIPLSLPSMLLR